MGKLYCVCSKADEIFCDNCPKYAAIKPDVCMAYDNWAHTLEPRILHYKKVKKDK